MARPAGTSSPPRRDAARRKQWKDLWREHKGLREASMPDEMFFGNFPHGRAAMGVNVNLAWAVKACDPVLISLCCRGFWGLMTCTRLGSFFSHPQRRGSGLRHEALPLEFSGAMSASYYVAHAELLG